MQQQPDNIDILHQQFQHYGRNAKEWIRKCALLLPEIHRRKIWEKKGFGSVFEYAGKLAGMSKSAVEEALWVVGKVEDKPELLRVIEEKGVSVVRPVASVATVATAGFWAEKAKEMSRSALQAYVHEIKRGRQSSVDLPTGRQEIIMQLPRELADRLEKLRAGGSWEDLLREFLIYREKTLASEKPETIQDAARHIPAEIVKFVVRRSRGLCEFGRCRKIYAILHHTQRFALESVHDPDRIVALCTAHERVVHMGLVEDEAIPPHEWRVLNVANEDDPKYFIDRLVQQYRKPG